MIKQAQTVYVPVSVDKRLPEISNQVYFIIDVANSKSTSYGGDITPFIDNKWLEPQQAIILSPDEWEKVRKCIEVLQEIVDADNMVLLNSHNIKAKQALSQLTELK